MDKREELQKAWVNKYIKYTTEENRGGILHLCPRTGKTRTSISIFRKFEEITDSEIKVLICYPDRNIETSWKIDLANLGYSTRYIDFTTHKSIHKIDLDNHYDIIVCDEVHLLSQKQIEDFKLLMENNKNSSVIGLSGTISKETEYKLKYNLGLNIIVNYTLEEAIKDGLISDYHIHVYKTDLDNKIIIDNKKNKTEKQKFNDITWVIENKGSNLLLKLLRVRILHNSISKLNLTNSILNQLKKERVLVYCANNKVAEQLNIKIHTTKNFNQEQYEEFLNNTSDFNHIVVCNIGNTGVNFKDLRFVVINAFDSNSENLTQRICRSLILDEKDKIANIYIISSTEKTELNWLNNSLKFFDENKITYYD